MGPNDATEPMTRIAITRGRVARVPTDAARTPAELEALAPSFRPIALPATLASALRDAGELDLSRLPNFEDDDAWFLATLPRVEGDGRRVLVLEGLATIADVFLNGEHVLSSTSSFHRHEIELGDKLFGEDTLAMRFRSLDAHLASKRPRPRWKTRLVPTQNLRFVRTSLLGRTTGYCPAVPAVGPYRPIYVECRHVSVAERRIRTCCVGARGVVDVALGIEGVTGIASARLEVEGASASLAVASGTVTRLVGSLGIADVETWWPHTHGVPRRYAARVVIEHADGTSVIPLGQLGFRTIASDEGSGFGLVVNGVPIFVRGAVWTTEDVVAQHASPAALRDALVRVRDAGMNLVRIGGTTAYESDAFHELTDELGILVFHDLMFANMDYPIDDADFRASVEREIRELCDRIAWRPSTAVICGNSEVEQQAAMLGLPESTWRGPLFAEIAPAIVHAFDPSILYVPSSPSGGTMPFHVDEGVGHYYGVGAYLRPIADARTTTVAFATECLAFANVPRRKTIEAFLHDLEAPAHHPRWKERVPRDRGASWDFEDVRDHYLEVLFGVSARELRYEDPERYLALSRVTTGEVMARVFAEWRREASPCRGGVAFFLQDFWPGAGFGLVDSMGRPKAAFFILARALRPIALLAIDEGVNGLDAHVLNDGPQRLVATLHARLIRDGSLELARTEKVVAVPAHGALRCHVDAMFPGFVDTTYAYRFGPPGHDLVHLSLVGADGTTLARAHHLPLGLARPVERDLGIEARFEDSHAALRVRSSRLAVFCALELEGLEPDDDFFHLAPGEERVIGLHRLAGRSIGRATIHPVNQRDATRIT